MDDDELKAWDEWDPMTRDHLNPMFNSYNRSACGNFNDTVAMCHESQHEIHRRGSQKPQSDTAVIHVSYIPSGLNELGVFNLFSKAGKVLRVKMFSVNRNPDHKEPLYSAKVTYGKLEEAEKAIYKFNKVKPFMFRVSMDRSYSQDDYMHQNAMIPRRIASVDNGLRGYDYHGRYFDVDNGVYTDGAPQNNCGPAHVAGQLGPARNFDDGGVEQHRAAAPNIGHRYNLDERSAANVQNRFAGQSSSLAVKSSSVAVSHADTDVYSTNDSMALKAIISSLEPKKDLSITIGKIDRQRSVQVSPSGPQVSPKVPQMSPNVPQMSPSAPQTSPSAPQTLPSAPQTLPSALQTSPSALQTSPIAPQTSPSVVQFSPKVPQASPKVLQVSPTVPKSTQSVQGNGQPNSNRIQGRARLAPQETSIVSHSPTGQLLSSMPPGQLIMEVCCVCKFEKSTMRCSKCKNADYCGIDCQMKDWIEHERVCVVPPAQKNKYGIRPVEKHTNSQSTIPGSGYSGPTTLSNATRALFKDDEQRSTVQSAVSVAGGLVANGDRERETPMNVCTRRCDGTSNLNSTVDLQNSSELLSNQKYVPFIPKDNRVKVYVSHVLDITHFFVQVESTFLKLVPLRQHMNSSNFVPNAVSCVAAGDWVCCRFKDDGLMYRAEVVKVNTNGSTLIRYIDYGNTETVLAKDLFTMSSQIRSFPPQVIICGLECEKNVAWTKEELELFRKMSESYKLHAKMVRFSGDGKSMVELFDAPENGLNLVQVLMSKRHPIPSPSIPVNASSVQSIRFPGDPSTVKSRLPVQLSCMDTWVVGGVYDLSFSDLADPGQVWAMGHGNMNAKRVAEFFSQLEAAGNEEVSPIENGLIQKNSVVIAKSPADDRWYRAAILSVANPPNTDLTPTYIVRYLDFGNREEQVKTVRLLPDRFSVLPSLAVLVTTEPGTTEPHDDFEVLVDEIGESCVKARVRQANPLFNSVVTATVTSVWMEIRAEIAHKEFTEISTDSVKVIDGKMEKLNVEKRSKSLAKDHEKTLKEPVIPIKVESQSQTLIKDKSAGNVSTISVKSGLRSSKVDDKLDCMVLSNVPTGSGNRSGVAQSTPAAMVPSSADVALSPSSSLSSSGDVTAAVGIPKCSEDRIDEFSPAGVVGLTDRTPVAVTILESLTSLQVQVLSGWGQRTLNTLKELSAACHDDVRLNMTEGDKVIGGQMVCVRSVMDGRWYRAEVQRLVPPHSAWLRLVDVGDRQKTKVLELKLVPPRFRDLPRVCREVTLMSSYPRVSLLKLRELVSPQSKWTAVLVDDGADSSTCPLVTLEDENGRSLDELLEATEIRNLVCDQPPPASLLPVSREEESQSIHSPSTCDQMKVGERLNVLIMHVRTPNEINICRLDAMEVFCQLTKGIEKECAKVQTVPYIPKLNDICIGKSSADDCWYRAKVFHVAKDKVHVVYIDYGNVEIISIDCVRLILPQLLEIAPCAIKCSLEGNSDCPEWPSDLLSDFKQSLAEGMAISVEVVSKTSEGRYKIRIPHLEEDFKRKGILQG